MIEESTGILARKQDIFCNVFQIEKMKETP